MVDPVKIEIEKADIYYKSDAEKLNFLIDIAFLNHATLIQQGRVIFGNGTPEKGLCFQVASQGTRLKWLTALLSSVGIVALGAIGTIIVSAILR